MILGAFKKSIQTKIAKGCQWTAMLAETKTGEKGSVWGGAA